MKLKNAIRNNNFLKTKQMTPKEKTKELFDKHFEFVEALSGANQIENAKKCALITVDEIIKNTFCEFKTQYWNEVKTEIKKITL